MIMAMTTESLSVQLRRRRKAIGLSLSQVARLAGTSAPAVSRYESAWPRFELYTLRKLASALRCRVRVELEPIEDPGPRPPAGEVVRRLRRLFWDHPLSETDLRRYPQWVAERVIEYGNLEDVRLLLTFMGREGFFAQVRKARIPSARTRAFWTAMFREGGMPCTRTFSRDPAASCWRT